MAAEVAIRREQGAPLPPDVAFLSGEVPLGSLEWAVREAGRLRVCAHEILLGQRLIDTEAYYRALAASIGARFAPLVHFRFPADPFAGRDPVVAARLGMLMIASGSRTEIASAPRGAQVTALVESIRTRPAAAERIVITTPQALTDALIACGQDYLTGIARTGAGYLPDAASARTLLCRDQALAAAAVPAALAGIGLLFPQTVLLGLTAVLGLFFFLVVGLRLGSAILGFLPLPSEASRRLADADLPVYTVLVPLYREAGLIDGLVAGLCELDYPAHRLDIKIIVEADDPETLAALRRRHLPPWFQIVTVPDAAPKTKPKALCFALALARGTLVTIFDAEDLPEPAQLRRAAERFAAEPGDVACLQARLAWFNWPESWFTRQMALEYASLFDVLLPALDRLGLPFPLGGTSNHFRGLM